MMRILCFGDSNTWGSRPDNNERFGDDERWPKVLRKLLGTDAEVIEEGHNGRTTVWSDPVEGKLSGFEYLMPCIESHVPFDVLIIMLGTNDCKERYGVNAPTIAFGLNRMVRQARFIAAEQKCHPRIIIVAPAVIKPVYAEHPVMGGLFGRFSDIKSAGLAEEYRCLAAENGCTFVDANDYAEASDIDGIHLDRENHGRLARALYEVIRKIEQEDKA